MGLVSGLRALHRQASELNKNVDPAARMHAGMVSMQAATAALQQQSAAMEVVRTGNAGTATILSLVDTGTRINNDAMVTLQLLVQIDGRPSYPVSATMTVPFHAGMRAGPGQRVAVMVDRADPQVVVVQWGHPVS
jgi:hypothetical protein